MDNDDTTIHYHPPTDRVYGSNAAGTQHFDGPCFSAVARDLGQLVAVDAIAADGWTLTEVHDCADGTTRHRVWRPHLVTEFCEHRRVTVQWSTDGWVEWTSDAVTGTVTA